MLVTPLDCECINRWWNRIWNLEQGHLAGTVKITHFSFISITQRWLHTDIKLALNEATYTSMTQDGAPVAGFSGTEHRSRDVVNDQNFWVKWSVWETIGGIFYSKASDWPFHSWQKANRRADPSVIRQVIRIRHQSLFRSDADAFSIKQVPVFFSVFFHSAGATTENNAAGSACLERCQVARKWTITALNPRPSLFVRNSVQLTSKLGTLRVAVIYFSSARERWSSEPKWRCRCLT